MNDRLLPGREYVVSQIVDDFYVMVPEYKDNPGDGIYWTEFQEKEAVEPPD